MPIQFLAALLVLAFAGVATAAELEISDEQRARLERGEVLISEGVPSGKGFAYHALGLVNAPPLRVWPVVRDCAAMDEYMPRMARADESEHGNDTYVCETEIELPFPLSNRVNAARSFLSELPGGIFRRQWSLVPGDWDYHRNDGSWTVHPWEDGTRTLLAYWLDAWLKSGVPDFVIHAAQTVQAPAVFDAIRERVDVAPASQTAQGPSDLSSIDVSAPPPDTAASR